MSQYNPRMVFRQTDNSLLQGLFDSRGLENFVDWKADGLSSQNIYDEFLKLPDDQRKQVEVDLYDIYTVASAKNGLKILLETAGFLGINLVDALGQHKNLYDKAGFVRNNFPEIWQNAVTIIQADSLSGRGWDRRLTGCKKKPDISEPARDRLRFGISSYFWQHEGRGKHCQVDHIQRNADQDYFFVYLSNHAGMHISFSDHGKLVKSHHRSAFEVVFIFDRTSGALDVYATGGKKTTQSLQEIFAKTILGLTLGPDDNKVAYHIDDLKDRNFEFATDPEDGISQVAIRMIRVSPFGNPRKKLTVKLPGDANPQEIYTSLENDLNNEKMSVESLRVERVGITMKLEGYGRKKSLTFEVGAKSCTLKSLPEKYRKLGEKYLKRWGIDRAE